VQGCCDGSIIGYEACMLWHPEHWHEENGFFQVPNCVLQTESRRRWVKYWDLRQKKDRVMGKPKTGIMQGDSKQ